MSYRIAAELDTTRGVVRGHERITWHNQTDGAARELIFHLYLNAFRGPDSIYWREAAERGLPVPSDPGARGRIEIHALRVNGRDRTAALTVDDTLGRLPLREPVEPGESIEIELDFVSHLPRIVARTGRSGDFFAIAQWFPKLGVFRCPGPSGPAPRACGFVAEPYHYLGEFFSDFGVYRVALTLPARFVVGATGVALGEERSGGLRTLHFLAEDVHDFAIAASPRFVPLQAWHRDAWGEIEVRALVQPEHADAARRYLASAEAALTELERLGPYPYRELTLIDVPDDARSAGSMEYPTLVFVQSHHAPRPLHAPEATAAHEVAHQLFYGLLASDEVRFPWLDEGLAEVFTARVLDQEFGEAGSAYRLLGHHLSLLELDWLAYRRHGAIDPPDARAFDFLDEDSYHAAAYSKIALAFATLARDLVGPASVAAGLRRYVEHFRFTHPSGADFVRAFDAGAGAPLESFWRAVLDRSGPLDDQVLEVAAQPIGSGYRSEVVIARRGEPAVPIALRVTFDDGSERLEHWDGGADGARSHRFVYVTRSPVREAILDPIPLDISRFDDGLRLKPDPSPRRRLAAGLGAALLGLLPLVGP